MMNSAVFAPDTPAATESPRAASVPPRAAVTAQAAAAPAERPAPRAPLDLRGLWLAVLPPALGVALLVGIWALATMGAGSALSTPSATFDAALKLFADPFYDNGPNDQGIGWNVLYSLQRVGVGFGLAAAVGIPLGFVIGRFDFVGRMFGPLISLLKPVSPLAWLPIGPPSGPSSSARSGRWW
jgi:nitrate/nitrite transport system permease protein